MLEIVEQAKEIAYRQDHMESRSVAGKRAFVFPFLEELGLLHLFSSRDQNLKLNGREHEAQLHEDWGAMIAALPKAHSEYYFMSQVHSNRVDPVETSGLGEPYLLGRKILREQGPDGLMTNRADYLLSSSFGDCAPLLFFDPARRVQANVHSGWKGSLNRIAANAVLGLEERYGSRPSDLYVAIGPHIGRADFEVDEDVAEPFRRNFPELEDLVLPHPDPEKPHKSLVDLNLCIAYVLLQSGVQPEKILNCGRSTVSHPEDYHSYRRDREAFGLMMVFSQIR